MSSYQISWLIFITPLFLVLGIIFLYNGWDTVTTGKWHANPVELLNVWLLRISEGEKAVKKYKNSLISDKQKVRKDGFNSLFGGLVYLVTSIYFALLLFSGIK